MLVLIERWLIGWIMDSEGLKEAGLRTTVQRLKILKVFEDYGQSHLSADDVYRALIEKGNEIGIATVYRVLAQFEAAGLINKLAFNNERSVYELAAEDHHDHMICTRCGMIKEFYEPELEQLQIAIAERNDFSVTHHNMTLYGLCAKCNSQ